MQSCFNCRFVRLLPSPSCRVEPPKFMMTNTPTGPMPSFGFPDVRTDWWCGKWSPEPIEPTN